MSRNSPIDESTSEQVAEDAKEYPALTRYGAEFFGTFLLVFGGVGTALLAAVFPDAKNALGVGHLGVALAFGLTLVAGISAVGHISGGHFNPAVTLGLWVAGRTNGKHVVGYWISQIIGGVVATSILAVILAGKSGAFDTAHDSGFASNGYGSSSPGGFGLWSVFITEAVLTAVFLGVILSVTAKSEFAALAPIVIGLTLTLIHLISIPVSNTSVNPARSIAAAIYGGSTPLGQLWVFIVAPLVGAAVAGVIVRFSGRRELR